MVNDADLMSAVPVCDSYMGTSTLVASNGECKTLGLMWDVKNDGFHFDGYTKSTMLPIIVSIFNPLGFVRPVTISGLMLFLNANHMNISWKQALPGDCNERWIAWLYSLEELSSIKFVICMKPASFNYSHLELHVFSDASQVAYGYVIYLRCVGKDGCIYVSLVYSKNKLVLIKIVSIPRFELQVVYMAATMEYIVRNELMGITLGPSTFW